MIDLAGARRFIHANARLLDTHRAAYVFDATRADPVLRTLAAYRNDDGGFGHGLEPDVRGPHSETTSTLHALEVLAEVDALDHPFVADAGRWVAGVAGPDAGVPFVLPASLAFPRGPWMQPGDTGGSHLTFGFAAALGTAGVRSDWLDAATAWCWNQLADPSTIGSYTLKYALQFLDAQPADVAARYVESLRPMIRPDGSVPVPGGTEHESLTVTTLSPRPGRPSRALFTEAQVTAALDVVEDGQREDGGWTVDYLPWCPAQAVEWRGSATFLALCTLRSAARC